MAGADVTLAEVLPADARSARSARALLREALAELERDDWSDRAQLAVTELVTNAVVHAGTEVDLRVVVTPATLRVEVTDGSTHEPVRRTYSPVSGTGRGLHLVDESVDRWDVALHTAGKTVWFELGDPLPSGHPAAQQPTPPTTTHEVTLLDVPLLMHWAWQEHAAALLREYLLVRLEEDLDALEQHADASEALSILHDQMPTPEVTTDVDRIMADAVEPFVTGECVLLRVPSSSVDHFATLERLLRAAIEMAEAGELLGPPTQPEISEMRDWICAQVLGQVRDGAEPVPWRARLDVRSPLVTRRHERYRSYSESDEPLLVTDEASVIVAATGPVVEFLGYRDEADLLGRRVIVVVPHRFHQAHIAGTTMHMTNGRDVLLGLDVTVPVLRADGSEVPVTLRVDTERVDDGHRVFVARFRLDEHPPSGAGTSYGA